MVCWGSCAENTLIHEVGPSSRPVPNLSVLHWIMCSIQITEELKETVGCIHLSCASAPDAWTNSITPWHESNFWCFSFVVFNKRCIDRIRQSNRLAQQPTVTRWPSVKSRHLLHNQLSCVTRHRQVRNLLQVRSFKDLLVCILVHSC